MNIIKSRWFAASLPVQKTISFYGNDVTVVNPYLYYIIHDRSYVLNVTTPEECEDSYKGTFYTQNIGL